MEALPPGAWTREQTTKIIGDARKTEFYKDRCSKAWDAFYADLRKQLFK